MTVEEKEVCMQLASSDCHSWRWDTGDVTLEQYYYAYYIAIMLGEEMGDPFELVMSGDLQVPQAVLDSNDCNVSNQEQYNENLTDVIRQYITDTYPTPIKDHWSDCSILNMKSHVFCGTVMVLNLNYVG